MNELPRYGVTSTALAAALVRADESRRDDALYRDTLASAFLEAAPGVLPTRPGVGPVNDLDQVFACYGTLRSRWFDDCLSAAVRSGGRQIVLLAAGLDTRAVRLALTPDVVVFELDLPSILRFKETVMRERRAAPSCRRVAVEVDLRAPWADALVDAGWRDGLATIWAAEGLLVYLSDAEARRMLTTMHDLSLAGSRFICDLGDLVDEALLAQAGATGERARFTSLWRGGLGVDTVSWLNEHAWQTRTEALAELANRYGRTVANGARGTFVSAERA